MKSKRIIVHRALLFAIALACTVSTVHAAGTDTWKSGGTANWSVAGNWTTSGGSTPPAAGDTIAFGTTTGVTTLNNDLTAALSFGGITFNSGASAYTFGGNSITLAGNISQNAANAQIINLAMAMTAVRTVSFGAGAGNVTLGGTLSGTSGGITASLAGASTATLTLSGSANAQTGTTTLNGLGANLLLDYSANNNAKLGTGSLTLSGGTLSLSGGSFADAVASTTLTAGTISTINTVNSSTATLNLKAITRNTASGLNFGAASIASTTTANTGNILGPGWATVNNTDWAVGGGTITALASYTDVTRLSSGTKTIANGSTSNVRIIEGTGSAADLTLAAATTAINSLNQNATGNAQIDPAGQTLQVRGILVGSGKGALTIGNGVNNGTLAAGSSGGELILNNQSVNTLTINSVIANNTSASSLASLAGTNVLTTASTYTGSTYVSGGKLQLSGSGTIPNSAVSVYNGTLDLNSITLSPTALTLGAVGTVNPVIAIGASGVLNLATDITYGFNSASASGTISGGTLNLNGNRTFSPGGSAPLTISANIANGSVSGSSLTVGNSFVTLSGSNTFTGTLNYSGNPGALTLANNYALTNCAGVNFTANNGSPLYLNAGTTISGVTLTNASGGNGAVGVSGTGTATWDGNITNVSAAWGNGARYGSSTSGGTFVIGTSASQTFGCPSGMNIDWNNNAAGSTIINSTIVGGPFTSTRFAVKQGTLTLNSTISSFTSPTIDITGTLGSGGILVVSNLANQGLNCSIGSGAVSGTQVINLGAGVQNMLKYVGTGDTCDRAIAATGTAGGYGAAIDMSGTGTLLLTGTITDGANTMQLQGSTTGIGQISGGIVNGASNNRNLAKAGTGTWILGGTSTYAGTTAVSGGTLLVNGSLASSGVTVSGGATFGGTGTIAGTLTVSANGIIQPTISGTPGTLTLSSSTAPTFTSPSTLKIRVPSTSTADQVSLSSTTPAFACANLDVVIDASGLTGNTFTTPAIVNVAKTSSGITGTFHSVTVTNNAWGYVPTVNYNSQTITVTMTASPTNAASGTLSAVNTTYGTASATPTSFAVSGNALTGNLTATPPAGYEISTSIGSGYATSLTLTPTSGTLTSTTVYVRLAATTGVGSYSGNIQISGGGATTLNIATVSSSVSAKPITVGASSGQSKIYGASDPTLTYTNTPLVGSDSFSGALSRAAGETVAGSPYAIALGTLTAGGNYTITFIPANFSITTRPITITAQPNTKNFDGGTSATNVPTLTGTLAGGDGFSSLTEAYATATIGTGKTVIPSATITNAAGSATANYAITAVNDTTSVISLAQATTTLLLTNSVGVTNYYGQALIFSAVVQTNSVTVVNASSNVVFSLGSTPVWTNAVSSGVAYYTNTSLTVGITNFTAQYAGDNNYLGSSVTVTQTVLQATPTLTLMASGITYGQTLAISSLSGSAATNANNAANVSGGFAFADNTIKPNAGTTNVSVIFTPSDPANYVSVTNSVSVAVGQAALGITANNASKTYDGLGYTGGNGVSYSGFVNSETPAVLGGTLAYGGTSQNATNAGSYTIIPTGLTSTNYAITYTNGTLTINPLGVTVTANGQTKVYGAADPALTYSYAPSLISGDSFSGALSRASGENIGSYAINQGGLALSTNYTLAYNGTNLVITPAALTVTANSASKNYGQTVTFAGTEFTTSGLQFSDSVTSATITSTGATNMAIVGTYPIVPSAAVGSGLGNYTISYVNGTLTVNPASTFVGASSTMNPSGYKDAVAYIATLPVDATGSVVFSSTNGAFSTNNLSSGTTTSITITNLARGTNVMTVTYLGDGNYLGSTTNIEQIVTNHPPVANNASYTRNAALNTFKIAITNLLANASDVDGDTLTLTSVGTPTNAAAIVMIGGGWVMYYNTNAAVDQFSYTVTDGFGGTNSATVSIAIDSTSLFGQSQVGSVLGGSATLNFAGIPGFSYSVLRSTNLVDWASIWTTNAPAGGVFQFIDTSAPMPSAYYQLRYNP